MATCIIYMSIFYTQGSLKFTSEQLEGVLLEKIYPLLSLYKFPRQLWADEAREKACLDFPVF